MTDPAPTFAPVSSQLADNSSYVRKHGTSLLAVADYSTPMPTSFFDATTGNPIVLPTGFMNLGYVSTKGFTLKKDMKSDDTTMLQDLDPVRSDLSSSTRTLAAEFGESSAWVKSLTAGIPVSAWPAQNSAKWSIDEQGTKEYPYLRLLLLSQDGVSDQAVYRVEAAYRAKITDVADRTMNRSDPEVEAVTFTCYKDPLLLGKSYHEESAPAVHA
ncbi:MULTISPECIES: hypothetical protein [Bifidobacterium]|jgi:hypothetical protein|uniref:Phage tail protein n=1 Tax=Bifidobacterium tibiigranuli TaxID=2172043 RepID=A0A5N6S6Y4_9BIFI|nr:hypothetical protein [Bifidobacterium tibiigranuli]KAE8130213.1 hypothetical protein DDE84_01145 [Bifidobacterium tibiigranuli]KAE8130428.1 hypothetical protein DDF78_00510 [Bifidobacterium tibiigranuli]MCI1212101.1 hypothetical protein [Bifidobacterium tibiigranuli]